MYQKPVLMEIGKVSELTKGAYIAGIIELGDMISRYSITGEPS